MKYLVTGGAGYIGSFMVDSLIKRGDQVVVLDNLSRGHKDSINSKAQIVEGDIKDIDLLNSIFSSNEISAIFHFAGLISVEESTKNTQLYFENNVEGSKILFDTAIKNGVNKFIFSSTAAVYGNPTTIPIPEDHAKKPTSPYGESKLKIEEYLSELILSNPSISFICLRYFNACGAALDGAMGEAHLPETHIIPLAIKAVLENRSFKIFGNDYDTPDGTCLRDYIHVLDLVNAHLLALDKINSHTGVGSFYNVGTGIGISNKEIVDMVSKVSGIDLVTELAERRAGDADKLIADPKKIKQELGFESKYSDINTIIESAWKWHNK